MEYVSPEGLRLDGRRCMEVQNRSQQISCHALVRCEYSMANLSVGDHMRKPKGDMRSTEIFLVICQTMEACILTHLLPYVYVQVLQADGGTRSTCINTATLALAYAGIPMRPLVTSYSAGYLNSTPLLDLNFVEDSAGGSYVTLGILPKLDKVTLLQMRQIRAEIGVVSKADGYAIFEMGNTKVIVAVYGPREVQNRSQQISSHALVRREYNMANFSAGDRIRKPKGDRRSTEISMVICLTMEACILTHLLSRSQVLLHIQNFFLYKCKLTRSTCINAATLALAYAGIPMRPLVTSYSAGYLNSTPLLDLNFVEDSAGGPDVTLEILPKLDKVTLLQMDSKLPIDLLENVMKLEIEGCKAIANYIREILLENTNQLEYR
uniref:Exosome complex exonuclease RRP41 n=1 Tax=Cajanus cajan TaxID=3821 RepID=A0A151S973_CAJCA|nr:Exosome complex exonuclease RRP41 [Cajanus cajan]